MASAETPSPVPAPANPGSDSSFGRIFGVLFSPKPTFEAIVRRPTWILPLILLVFVGLAATTLITQRVTWRTVIDRAIEKSPKAQKRVEQIPPEKRDDTLNGQAKFTEYAVYVINVLAPFIVAVVAAAMLYGGVQCRGRCQNPVQDFAGDLCICLGAWIDRGAAGNLSVVY